MTAAGAQSGDGTAACKTRDRPRRHLAGIRTAPGRFRMSQPYRRLGPVATAVLGSCLSAEYSSTEYLPEAAEVARDLA